MSIKPAAAHHLCSELCYVSFRTECHDHFPFWVSCGALRSSSGLQAGRSFVKCASSCRKYRSPACCKELSGLAEFLSFIFHLCTYRKVLQALCAHAPMATRRADTCQFPLGKPPSHRVFVHVEQRGRLVHPELCFLPQGVRGVNLLGRTPQGLCLRSLSSVRSKPSVGRRIATLARSTALIRSSAGEHRARTGKTSPFAFNAASGRSL